MPRTLEKQPHPLQIEILSRMTADGRLRIWSDLSSRTLEMSFAGLRARHPRLGERELRKRFVSLLHGEEIARKMYA